MSNSCESIEVPYIASNLERCVCSQCPVQSESSCALEKVENFKNEVSKLKEGKAPTPQNVPGVYCSAGEAFCKDLNVEKNCICNTCSVWKENNLNNACIFEHYCSHGRA
ncbi:MAG TPA: DUF2769 domain-containing protein [Methanosarcina sp.]|jgi:hypothetical protein